MHAPNWPSSTWRCGGCRRSRRHHHHHRHHCHLRPSGKAWPSAYLTGPWPFSFALVGKKPVAVKTRPQNSPPSPMSLLLLGKTDAFVRVRPPTFVCALTCSAMQHHGRVSGLAVVRGRGVVHAEAAHGAHPPGLELRPAPRHDQAVVVFSPLFSSPFCLHRRRRHSPARPPALRPARPAHAVPQEQEARGRPPPAQGRAPTGPGGAARRAQERQPHEPVPRRELLRQGPQVSGQDSRREVRACSFPQPSPKN